jgi:hypothetical protein
VLARSQWVKAFIVGSASGLGPLRDLKDACPPIDQTGSDVLADSLPG